MRKIKGLFLLLAGFGAYSQQSDSTLLTNEKNEPDNIWLFSAPRLINANTVEMKLPEYLNLR
jgi:hypothetical protein